MVVDIIVNLLESKIAVGWEIVCVWVAVEDEAHFLDGCERWKKERMRLWEGLGEWM